MGIRARALKSLHLAWTTKIQGMQGMNQATEVRPLVPQQVIRVDARVNGGTVKLDCGPAVFLLCEKANGIPEMYVVVEGSLCVKESGQSRGSLETTCFSTKVGYFRSKRNRLEHVYGVHYDMDERGDGHPVFHAQLRPARDFASVIRSQFRLGTKDIDHVKPILRNVRTPTAQMDFFSVVTQLCADHLVSVNSASSDSDVMAAFNDVRAACGFLRGAAHRLRYLNSGGAPMCYRSSHWYSRP